MNNAKNKTLIIGTLSYGVLSCAIGYFTYSKTNRTREYTINDVSKHNEHNDLWVSYKNKVYDITKFVNIHPGGKENILMAGGGPIDIYWNLYKQHNTDYVKTILEKYHIGNLIDEVKIILDDEYISEPKREMGNLIVHKREPFNAEPNNKILLNSYLTCDKNWFTRNHHPVPSIDINDFNLTIGGKIFKYKDIINKKYDEIITTIQCAGNRRSEFNALDIPMGLSWGGGAISSGKWTGVWLNDIIEIPKDKKYINLIDYNYNFSVSVPINTKLFLAYKMNNEILSRDRGFPLRIIAPGLTGSKNVKWIQHIEFSNEEINSVWQTGIAYKKFPNTIKKINKITENLKLSTPTINELPVQSYICNTMVLNDTINITGYAIAGLDKYIKYIEISNDNGKTWQKATIVKGKNIKNAWCFWEITLPYESSIIYKINNADKNENINLNKYMCRATDNKDNSQMNSLSKIWNIRGISNNSPFTKSY